MKKNILVGSLVVLIFSGILVSSGVAQQFPTPPMRPDGPRMPVPPKPGEMFQRMEDMMHRLRGDGDLRSHCETLTHTPFFLDSPAVIRAQAASLNLSPDQIQKLTDIENEARQKAKSLLNEEQLKKLGNIPEKPVVMSDTCLAGMLPAAEQLLQKIIRGQGTTQNPESKSDDSEKKAPTPAE
jgi:hypothetical protein